MSSSADALAGSTEASESARDWEAIRASTEIQYAPLKQVPPPEPPGWLKDFGEWLASLLEPLGKLLGISAKPLMWILIALAVLMVAWLAWKIVQSWLSRKRRPGKPEDEPAWLPERAKAVALLEDADRLAAQGRFGEAAHLLLQRSVHHIAEAKPDWLLPASTAREISRLPLLPDAARRAFATIAERVERSLFALRELDSADWQAARGAYADFALADLGGIRA